MSEENRKPLVICVDFDGTCVSHQFPDVGREIGAAPVLKEIVENGCKIILFTMRSGEHLPPAVFWFELHGIPLFGVNINPEQRSWTSSPKAYGHIYIDDAALGCPLITDDPIAREAGRGYVDWAKVREMLVSQGVLHG